jgi:5-methylcytosine-specific restriction endonuclease McrA
MSHLFHKRTKRDRGLPSTFNTKHWETAQQYFGWRCAFCGERHAEHADHWIPISSDACPGTTPTNMIPLCATCNCSKNDTDPVQYLRARYSAKKARRIIRDVETFFIYMERFEY